MTPALPMPENPDSPVSARSSRRIEYGPMTNSPESLLNVFRVEEGSFIDPDLQRRVEEAIREYPNTDAPSWLGGIAAIRVIEDWLIEHGYDVRSPDE